MSTNTQAISDDQVRSAFQRWKNLEEEKARIGDDLKELFAEQKAFGHDTKAMRAAFRLKVKIDEADPADAEHEALVDTYLAALDAPRASRVYARENIEKFDASPRLIKQVVDGMQTEAGRAALIAAVDIMIEREEAKELEASDGSPSVSSSLTTREAEESVVSVSEKATVATQGEAMAPTSDKRVSLPVCDRSDAAANTEGEHVESSGKPAGLADPTSNTGEGAASALPAKYKLRPNCQRPGETCGGYGDKHCHDCLRSMREYEAA